KRSQQDCHQDEGDQTGNGEIALKLEHFSSVSTLYGQLQSILTGAPAFADISCVKDDLFTTTQTACYIQGKGALDLGSAFCCSKRLKANGSSSSLVSPV